MSEVITGYELVLSKDQSKDGFSKPEDKEQKDAQESKRSRRERRKQQRVPVPRELKDLDALTPEEAVELILNGADHFERLQLPKPVLNDIRETIWPVLPETLREQFLKLSRLTHPDKHPDLLRAGDAFELVTTANRTLSDTVLRDAYIKEFGISLVPETGGWNPSTSVTEKLQKEIELNRIATQKRAAEVASQRSKMAEKIRTAGFDKRKREQRKQLDLDSDEDSDKEENSLIATIRRAKKKTKKGIF